MAETTFKKKKKLHRLEVQHKAASSAVQYVVAALKMTQFQWEFNPPDLTQWMNKKFKS